MTSEMVICYRTDQYLHIHSFGSTEHSRVFIISIGFYLYLSLEDVPGITLQGIKCCHFWSMILNSGVQEDSLKDAFLFKEPSRIEVEKNKNGKRRCSWQVWENSSLALCCLPGGQEHSLRPPLKCLEPKSRCQKLMMLPEERWIERWTQVNEHVVCSSCQISQMHSPLFKGTGNLPATK